jgi:hypothetical protein
VTLRIPQSEGKALALVEARARIYGRQYRDGWVEIKADVPESALRKLSAFRKPEFEPAEIDSEPRSRTVLRERR